MIQSSVRKKALPMVYRKGINGDMAFVLLVTCWLFVVVKLLKENNLLLKELKQNVDSFSELLDSLGKLAKKIKELLKKFR